MKRRRTGGAGGAGGAGWRGSVVVRVAEEERIGWMCVGGWKGRKGGGGATAPASWIIDDAINEKSKDIESSNLRILRREWACAGCEVACTLGSILVV